MLRNTLTPHQNTRLGRLVVLKDNLVELGILKDKLVEAGGTEGQVGGRWGLGVLTDKVVEVEAGGTEKNKLVEVEASGTEGQAGGGGDWWK
jgi:hypothetical protein